MTTTTSHTHSQSNRLSRLLASLQEFLTGMAREFSAVHVEVADLNAPAQKPACTRGEDSGASGTPPSRTPNAGT